MNVAAIVMSQPMPYAIHMAPVHGDTSTRQIEAGSDCHSPNTSTNTTLAANTYVDRSAEDGTNRSRRCLTPSRAITECCSVNNNSRPTSTGTASHSERVGDPSMVWTIGQSDRNPIAHNVATRNVAYARTAYAMTTTRPDREATDSAVMTGARRQEEPSPRRRRRSSTRRRTPAESD